MNTQKPQQKSANKQDDRAKKVRQLKRKLKLAQSHIRNMIAASK